MVFFACIESEKWERFGICLVWSSVWYLGIPGDLGLFWENLCFYSPLLLYYHFICVDDHKLE